MGQSVVNSQSYAIVPRRTSEGLSFGTRLKSCAPGPGAHAELTLSLLEVASNVESAWEYARSPRGRLSWRWRRLADPQVCPSHLTEAGGGCAASSVVEHNADA